MKKLLKALPLILILFSFNTAFAQWTRIANGMETGHMYSLAFNTTRIFAGTYDGGVFYSTNNGASYVRSSFDYKTVSSLAYTGSTVFAGTYDSAFISLRTMEFLGFKHLLITAVSVPSLSTGQASTWEHTFTDFITPQTTVLTGASHL
jgi:hypothetical protein